MLQPRHKIRDSNTPPSPPGPPDQDLQGSLLRDQPRRGPDEDTKAQPSGARLKRAQSQRSGGLVLRPIHRTENEQHDPRTLRLRLRHKRQDPTVQSHRHSGLQIQVRKGQTPPPGIRGCSRGAETFRPREDHTRLHIPLEVQQHARSEDHPQRKKMDEQRRRQENVGLQPILPENGGKVVGGSPVMSLGFIDEISRTQGIQRRDLIEKDLLLHRLLHHLSRQPEFKENYLFKGGTCLIKGHLPKNSENRGSG